MKKQLLSIFAAMTVTSAVAQFTVSPSWSITQAAAFPNPTLGIKFLDAIDANVVWLVSGDYANQTSQTTPAQYYSRTNNGGNTFTSGIIPNVGENQTFEIGNIVGIDANTAWISCYYNTAPGSSPASAGSGSIFKTSDGGATWVNMTPSGMYSDANASFGNSVAFLTPSVGITMGDPVNGEYEIWRTLDGGLSWVQVPGANIPNPLSNQEFGIVDLYTKQGNSNIWFGTNQGRIYRSTDAGLTWSVSVVSANTATLTDIAFTSPLDGLVFSQDPNGNGFELYKTTNGGATWTIISPVSDNVGRADLVAIPGTNYYASLGLASPSNTSVISYSDDGGFTWTDWGSVDVPYAVIDFVDATHGWAGNIEDATSVGGYSNIYKFTGDYAITPTVTPLSSAFYLSPNLCLTAGTASASPVNNSTGSGILSYTWSALPSGAVFSNAADAAPIITFSANGSYTITLEVSSTDTGTLTSLSSQVVSIISCVAPTSTFSFTASPCNNIKYAASNTSAGTPAPSYSWVASPNTVTFSPSSVAATPSVSFADAGDYTLTLISTNSSGSVAGTQVIHVNDCRPIPAFSLSLGVTSTHSPFEGWVCRSSTSFKDTLYTNNLSTPGTGGTTVYTWSISPTVTMANNGPTNKRISFTGSASTVYTLTLIATNPSGSNSVSTMFSVSTCYVGLNENSLAGNINVYPNPAHEQITLSLPDAGKTYHVKIMNVLGSLVHEETVKNSANVNINLTNKVKGIYFLSVEANGEKAVQKIIIE